MRKYLFSMVITGLLASLTACGAMENRKTGVAGNPVLETIAERKSVRRYTEQEVGKDTIDLILKAGMAAPSSKDRRPWYFVVLDDRAALDSLAGQLPYAKMLAHTRQAIVVCGDETISESWYLDCSAASQNILLAIESLGLAGVWTGVYPYADRMAAVQECLGLPGHVYPLSVIPFGYSAGVEKPKDKYDAERIKWNKW